MLVLFTVIHAIVAIFLIIVILLQAGKDAGMGSALGGGGSGSVFGGRGAGNLLSRTTAVVATIFFITSFALSFAASYRPTVTNKMSQTTTGQQATQTTATAASTPADEPAVSASTNDAVEALPNPADNADGVDNEAVPAEL